jgi:membrane fusion protein (multidrug efflux system)
MFKINPIQYKAKYDAEVAELRKAELEYMNTKRLAEDRIKVVSDQEVAIYQASYNKAKSNVERAEAELNFATVRAPFDGIIDRQEKQLGSTIKEGEILTTLSDTSVMRVYFNVPEVRYLEYKKLFLEPKVSADPHEGPENKPAREEVFLTELNRHERVELVLMNGSKFPHAGRFTACMGKFNNETGNIPFRADFPNPDGLLRHGQSGKVLVHRTLNNAVVIPQRATYEILEKRYVYVVGKDNVVRQREITVQHELDDIFVIKSGLTVEDRIVLDGVRQVRDGEKVEYEFHPADKVLANQKHEAE